jgi:hypothetical protein
MKTVTLQIGNTDDKLTQKEWAQFVAAINYIIGYHCKQIHFAGGSNNEKPWQNYCWVFDLKAAHSMDFKRKIANICADYRQDSIAVTVGETKFIKP